MSNQNLSPASINSFPTPLEKFYENEKQRGDETCFVQPFPNGHIDSISWHECANQVRRMANHLKSLELEAGSRIAILSSNCAYWIMADIAIWMAGHISVPLYPVLSANSVRQILEHSQSRYLFVGKLDEWDKMSAGVPEDVTTIGLPICPESPALDCHWNDIIVSTSPMTDNPVRPREDLATIIYTSGTTGMPKGVMHSFSTMAIVGVLTGELYGCSDKDRMLSYLPLAHVAERAAVQINQLYQGFTVYFSNSLETFAEDLRRAQPTLFFAVPRIWVKLHQRVLEQVSETKLRRLLKIPFIGSRVRKKLTQALGLDQLRIGVSGAAPISTSLMAWYESLGITILEGYAMSENFAYSHSTKPGESRIGYVGTASPFVDCKISPEGEVLIKSPTNMMGYYKEPELTAETLDADGYLHTGDKGEVNAQHQLRITGRFKEIFKTSKGKYVAPAPIEDLLLRNSFLEQICVTGADLPQPIALATLSEQAINQLSDSSFKQQLADELQRLLKETNASLDKHENLSCIALFDHHWTVDNNFMTPTLKVKRAELEKAYADKFPLWSKGADSVLWVSA